VGALMIGMSDAIPAVRTVESGSSGVLTETLAQAPKIAKVAPTSAVASAVESTTVSATATTESVAQASSATVEYGNVDLGEAGPAVDLGVSGAQARATPFHEFTEAQLDANAARVATFDQYGAASIQRGGTEARSGPHFHEFNAAEVALAMRVDYDPQAGR